MLEDGSPTAPKEGCQPGRSDQSRSPRAVPAAAPQAGLKEPEGPTGAYSSSPAPHGRGKTLAGQGQLAAFHVRRLRTRMIQIEHERVMEKAQTSADVDRAASAGVRRFTKRGPATRKSAAVPYGGSAARRRLKKRRSSGRVQHALADHGTKGTGPTSFGQVDFAPRHGHIHSLTNQQRGRQWPIHSADVFGFGKKERRPRATTR